MFEIITVGIGLGAVGILLVIGFAFIQLLPPSLPASCDSGYFQDTVVELLNRNKPDTARRALKLYSGAEELVRAENVLRCRGTVRWDSGPDSSLTYHYEIDPDGDTWTGTGDGPTPIPAR